MQTIVDSDTSETFTFCWKVSCKLNNDYLIFYIDGNNPEKRDASKNSGILQLTIMGIFGGMAWPSNNYIAQRQRRVVKWEKKNAKWC